MAGIGTGFNAGSSELGQSIAGSDNNAVARDGSIALGMNAKLNQGLEFGSASNVTIGETGLGQTFANTVRELTTQQNTALAGLLQGRSESTLPAPSDLEKTSSEVGELKKDRFWLIAGVTVTVISIVLFILKRK